MTISLDASDVIILSIAATCIVAAVLLELLRIVIPDIYEWAADHRKVRQEIADAKRQIDRMTAHNTEQAALRDRKALERMRLKSLLNRAEMTLQGLQRDSVEVWHELGQVTLGENLYVSRLSNRMMADRAVRDADSAPLIWKYTNSARIWAVTDRVARQRLQQTFPTEEGYAASEVSLVQPGPATRSG